MSDQALLLAILMAFMSGAAIFYPLMSDSVFPKKRQKADRAADLQEQLDQNLLSIRDLDSDFDMGKVLQEDYIKHRKELIGRGVGLLIRLDQALDQQEQIDSEIEALIQDYRRQQVRL